MTTFVMKRDGFTRVQNSMEFEFGFVDGQRDYGPDELLFDRPAKNVVGGVYTDEGVWLGSFEEWLLR